MPLARNDEITIRLTAGEINQMIMLAEDGFRSLIGKVVRQLNEQAPPTDLKAAASNQ